MTVYDIARELPDIETLRRRCRALAMLSAIFQPDNDHRFYRYTGKWRPGADVATMASGGGDSSWVVFEPAGVYIQGFDHESAMSPYAADEMATWPGVVDSVPEVFRKYLTEPAFLLDGVPAATACLWREITDDQWRTGTIEFPESGYGDVDGAGYLFGMLTGSAEDCQNWAGDYYAYEVDIDAVRAVLSLQPLTPELVATLNPEADLAVLGKDVDAIGYPRHP
ncbi:hypothetical protein [Kibdelosporangium persicum]|uniref:hypothetical protein n=1 Tax=Kibdelosporangium persicum TaxID=2698649 RepID=UPI00156334A5|nr:hypothetical protein [Kibdelosporangium persicum]